MTFDEWFHKEYWPADLQIKQCAERNEVLPIPATAYLEDLKEAFEAGLHTDVHTDNSKVIAELEAQIEKMKCCGNCAKYNSGYGENPCKMGASMICGEWETFIGKF